jgi:hypothetical protein
MEEEADKSNQSTAAGSGVIRFGFCFATDSIHHSKKIKVFCSRYHFFGFVA